MNDEDPISVNLPKKKQKNLEQPNRSARLSKPLIISGLDPSTKNQFFSYVILTFLPIYRSKSEFKKATHNVPTKMKESRLP